MDITIKKIKAAKGKLVFEYGKKADGNTPISTHKSTFKEDLEPSYSTDAAGRDAAIIAAMWQSSTDIRQIVG